MAPKRRRAKTRQPARKTARLAAEKRRLGAELERRLAELSSVQELTHVLASSLRLDRVVGEVARYAMRVSGAAGAALSLVEQKGGMLECVAAEGSLAPCLGRRVAADAAGLLGEAIGHERVEVRTAPRGSRLTVCADIEARSVMVAPLRAHGVTTGAVAVVDKHRGVFGDDDARILSTLAAHAALAVANARFFELIRRGKEQWEATFDALTEGIALVDAEGLIRRANAGFAALLKRPIPAVIGAPLCHALFGEHQTLESLLAAVRGGERPAPVVRRSQSLGRILRVAAAPVASPEADVVVVVEDITEQQTLEAQLIQSEKMSAVGTLVSGVAHELNNPLTSIAGLSEFLLEQPPGGEHEREHLRVVHDQAERASRIVRNLLSFARKAPSERSPVDLGELVERTVTLMGYELRQQGVEAATHIAPDLATVVGNRDQLQQVVLNLLTNAAHALASLPEDRPRNVEVGLANEGERVVLRVSDTGPGIPAEAVAHIFDPFFTTKPPGEGTGLGLFLSYGIAQSHGGTLTVESPPGGGATFVLSLPRAAPGSLAPAAAAPAPTPGRSPAAPTRRVLVVDDDPAVRRLVTALFTAEGHRVDAAASGTEGIRLAGQSDYDLVIADRRAAADGEPFVAALARLHADWTARVIVSTSEMRLPGGEARETASPRLLPKPFNLRELRAAAAHAWEAAGPA